MISWLSTLTNTSLGKRKKRLFFDYASSTPVLPEVKKMMDRYWIKSFCNPSAIYKEGVAVKDEIKQWRARLARSLGVTHKSVVFTSGGTESDNLAILGAFEASIEKIKQPHLIVSAIDHPAVLATAEEVERRGGVVTVLPVNSEGLVSIEALKKALKKSTFLVSIGLANSEIGIVQPIAKIGRVIREYRKKNESLYPYLHTDANQASGLLALNLDKLHVDLLTLDASKIYGPRGIGALIMREGLRIHPLLLGGGQESGRRSGTLNPALIAGFVSAFEIAERDREGEFQRLEALRGDFVEYVDSHLPTATVNGSKKYHLPSIVSVSVPSVLSEFLVLKLEQEGVLVSVGTACSLDQQTSGSPVIRAIGKPELSESTLRFSFGRFTKEEHVKTGVQIFCRVSASMLKSV